MSKFRLRLINFAPCNFYIYIEAWRTSSLHAHFSESGCSRLPGCAFWRWKWDSCRKRSFREILQLLFWKIFCRLRLGAKICEPEGRIFNGFPGEGGNYRVSQKRTFSLSTAHWCLEHDLLQPFPFQYNVADPTPNFHVLWKVWKYVFLGHPVKFSLEKFLIP